MAWGNFHAHFSLSTKTYKKFVTSRFPKTVYFSETLHLTRRRVTMLKNKMNSSNWVKVFMNSVPLKPKYRSPYNSTKPPSWKPAILKTVGFVSNIFAQRKAFLSCLPIWIEPALQLNEMVIKTTF